MQSSNIYFAAKEGEETVAVLMKKAHAWMNNTVMSVYLEKVRDMWKAYHGIFDGSGGHKITYGGEQGELVNLYVNHIRNLASHILTMTTANRPAMEARAINTDYKSQVQTMLANDILDYYLKEKRLEITLKDAVEYAIVMGAGFIKMEWNSSTGEIVDFIEETQTEIREGDIEFTNLSPFDVVYDGTKESKKHDWVLVRTWKNKFDLAAKYPEHYDKIASLETKSDMERIRLGMEDAVIETDDIPVYEFYHKKTDALPDGRYLLFLAEDIILQDLPMPYRMLPVFRIAPSDILGTPYGYTHLFDILPIQEAINSLYSSILTNQVAYAVQNVLNPRGNDVTMTQVTGGMNWIEYNAQAGAPSALQLCSTPAEVFQFLQILETTIQTLSGVNSVTRGNATDLGSNPSGSALALVQSMALQFMSGLQQSYVMLIEDVGTALIKMLQDFAATKRVISIVGKSNLSYLREFTNEDISDISRVVVDVGNPMANSTAGKVQMASELLQYAQGKITPAQYLNVVKTGNLDVATQGVQHVELLMQRENERLLTGGYVVAVFTDDHLAHINKHKEVFSDPALRENQDLMIRASEHIQEHINLLRTTDPDTLMLLGQQPLQPMGMPTDQLPQMGPMDNEEQAMGGPVQQGEEVVGPGIEQGVNMPNQPKVDASLLPNPSLEPRAE